MMPRREEFFTQASLSSVLHREDGGTESHIVQIQESVGGTKLGLTAHQVPRAELLSTAALL